MNRKWYWDGERGLMAVRRSPDARDYPTADEIKRWMATGEAPASAIEPDRCAQLVEGSRNASAPGCEYCGTPLERERERERAYRALNLHVTRAWRKTNPDKVRAMNRRWYLANALPAAKTLPNGNRERDG